MSAIKNTRTAVERKIATLNLPIAREGVSFAPGNPLYLRVQYLIGPPDDPVIGDAYYRERITLQVFVADVLNAGAGNATAVAELVRALFKKGETMQEGTTRIYSLKTPQISGPMPTADRLVVPVLIDLVAEVFN